MARHVQPWSPLDPQDERYLPEIVWSVASLQDETDPNFQLALNFAWSNLRGGAGRRGAAWRGLSVGASRRVVAGRTCWAECGAEADQASRSPRRPCHRPLDADQALLIVSGFFCHILEKTDDFDLGKFLMEGEEMDIGPDMDTLNWSRESDEENDQQPLNREDSGIQVDRTPLEEQDQNRKLGPCISWKVGPTVPSSQMSQMTEAGWNIMWFIGVKKLFIFQLIDKKVTVRNNIIVTHLTHFPSQVLGFLHILPERVQHTQAVDIHTPIYATITRDSGGQVVTLIGSAQGLNRVFSTRVAEVPPDTQNVWASHLLNTLYKVILEYDNVGDASEQTVSLLFSPWVEMVWPYLQTVDESTVHGHLWDNAREFIIQSMSEKTESEEKISDNASASSGSDQGPSRRQHTMVSFLKAVLSRS
ncbi:hypothetical protein P7K49_037128 [Saguinus oedipus]|uniref:Uncharacterized protein n=1 Tax=Saguinus oedipus TaxID=9490 RepID=A0ABQ9TH44_SAGOE|nr:hypothetical protein P7K49_037128 [Saguinus oedipus]